MWFVVLLLVAFSLVSSDAVSVCAGSGKLPDVLEEPRPFCGRIIAGYTCCSPADDDALSREFHGSNIPGPPEAMAAVKKSMCERRCRPRALPNEGQRAPASGFDDDSPPLTGAVQQLLPPRYSWLLLVGPFALYGLYLACNKFIGVFSDPASASSTPRIWGCGLCSSITCACCSTITNVTPTMLYGTNVGDGGVWPITPNHHGAIQMV